MSKKIKNFLNILEQKNERVERELSINKEIIPILDECFPDRGMFFYDKLEIFCKVKNFNYENIKNSKCNFLQYLYDEECLTCENDIEILIGSLKNHYFTTSRNGDFSKLDSIVIPFAYYYYKSSHIIDIKENGMSILIDEYDDFKVVCGDNNSNHRLYGIYRGFDEFKDSKLLLNSLRKRVYKPANNDLSNYIRTYILPKASDGVFVLNLNYENNLFFHINNSPVKFYVLDCKQNPLEKTMVQELLKIIEIIYSFFESKEIKEVYFRIEDEYQRILKCSFRIQNINACIALGIEDLKLFNEELNIPKFGLIYFIKKMFYKDEIVENIDISRIKNIQKKQKILKYFFHQFILYK